MWCRSIFQGVDQPREKYHAFGFTARELADTPWPLNIGHSRIPAIACLVAAG
jgi:hypothetical protein